MVQILFFDLFHFIDSFSILNQTSSPLARMASHIAPPLLLPSTFRNCTHRFIEKGFKRYLRKWSRGREDGETLKHFMKISELLSSLIDSVYFIPK